MANAAGALLPAAFWINSTQGPTTVSNVQRAPRVPQPIDSERESPIRGTCRHQVAGTPGETSRGRPLKAPAPVMARIGPASRLRTRARPGEAHIDLPGGWLLLLGPEGGRKNLRGDHCRCSGPPYTGCGEHFNSTYAFDKHRTGDYSNRRCLSPDEMRAKGMVQNAAGWWLSSASKRPMPQSPAITGAAIGADPLSPQGGWAVVMSEREVMDAEALA
jgi:hypothetical protein